MSYANMTVYNLHPSSAPVRNSIQIQLAQVRGGGGHTFISAKFGDINFQSSIICSTKNSWGEHFILANILSHVLPETFLSELKTWETQTVEESLAFLRTPETPHKQLFR